MEIADTLRDAGWEVLEASSGEGALEFLDAGQQIDLLVTDIRLAGPLTGWEVAEAYRKKLPKIGVIYASANPADQDRQVAQSVFFEKPCHMEKLVEVGRELSLAAGG
jgi:CheY-like chemotaxis protein